MFFDRQLKRVNELEEAGKNYCVHRLLNVSRRGPLLSVKAFTSISSKNQKLETHLETDTNFHFDRRNIVARLETSHQKDTLVDPKLSDVF